MSAFGRVPAHAGPLWRAVLPVARIVQPLGWVVLVVSVLLLSSGRILGWFEVSVAGSIGCAVLIISVFFVFGRSHYSVDVRMPVNRVSVGERAVGEIVVVNASERTLLPARLELPVGSASAVFPLPLLGAHVQHDELFTIPTTRRSVIVVGPPRAVRGDPLGLLARVVTFGEPIRLFVHPRTRLLAGTAPGILRDLEGEPTEDLSNSDISFRTLRIYEAGDDRRYIHWKTSARTGTLMVRQFEETRRSHVAIALSTSTAEYGDDDEFELAVSVSASLGLLAFADGRTLSVVTSSGPLVSTTGIRMLDGFSGVLLGSAAGPVALARLLAQSAPQASLDIIVTGGVAEQAALQSAARQLPVGARVLVIRCVSGAGRTRQTIGAVTLLTVGSLDDLPRALRGAA